MSSLTVDNAPRKPHYPPGPHGHWLFGTVREFQTDMLNTITDLHRRYGDAVRYRFFLNFYGYSFIHPDHYKHILQDNNKSYTKQPHPTNQLFKPIVGDGLLTNDGDSWRRQRRLAQPAFHRRTIAGFGTTMTEATLAMLDRWQGAIAQQQPLDIAHEMMQLTLEIAGKTLFSTDLTGEARAVGDAFTRANELFAELNVKPFSLYTIRLPFWPSTRRLNRDVVILDGVVNKIIAERRQEPSGRDDLLAMLMQSRDEETGESMDDHQLRDEVMTLLLAGHETTAVALTWAFYLLSQHPAGVQRLAAELDEVLGGETPTVAPLPPLDYTRMVIEETMRLYPPAYGIARWGNQADQVGGFDIPANAVITLMPYLTHRHPAFWPEPEKFDPERFTAERVAERPRFAYLPFGGGPRQCIGNNFAMTEAILLLATIMQRCRLALLPGHQVALQPLITLRPRGGMPMVVRQA